MTTSLNQLVAAYDAFLLDAYGVFWGSSAVGMLPGAKEAMAHLVQSGKQVGILSNSTQLANKEKEKLEKHGVKEGTHYHFLLTSGEVAKEMLAGELPFPTPRNSYFLFGNPHPTLFQQTRFKQVSEIREADFIYIGVPQIDGADQENPDVFREQVRSFAKIPVLCANPDCFAQEGSPPRPVVRQGTIAKLFEEAGAQVFYIGKPHRAVYDIALSRFPRNVRVLMVGDTPETDIRGARKAGIDSALITKTGIFAARLSAIVDLPELDRPTHLLERLYV